MEAKTDILNELRSISPLLAGMEKVNVFKVPEGYFNSISETVLACLGEDAGPANKLNQDKNQSAGVPEGYFDNLADAILGKIKGSETASTEISNLSPILHAIQTKNVFDVPDGYFDNVGRFLLDKIKTDEAKIELKELSPLLYDLREKAVLEVPEGYFESLGETVLKKVKTPKAKVFSIYRRNLFIKYAIAAMMTGVLAFGIYKFTDRPTSIVIDSSPVASLDDAIEKGKNMNDQQFNEALESLSEADIAKYLEKNGNIADVAVLGNDIDAGNLPSQEDYLLDEKTLENYLKEIDSTSLNN